MNRPSAKDRFPSFNHFYRYIVSTFRRIGGCTFKMTKRTWKGALAVLLILMVAHGVVTFVMGRKVEAELAKIKANGEPVFSADLAGTPIPDELNGAVIYQKAFDLINAEAKKQKPEVWDDNDLLALEDRNNLAAWEKAKMVTNTFRQAFDFAEEASRMSECRFKSNWEDGHSTLLLHYMPLRQLARLMAARAVLQARDGDMAGAVGSIEQIIKMSYAIKDDDILIGVLNRLKIIRTSATALKLAMEYGQFSDVQASSLVRAFSQVDLSSSCVSAMQGERAMILTTFSQIQRNPSGYMSFLAEDSLFWRAYWTTYTSYLGRPLFYKHQLESLHFMEKQIDITRLPYREIRKHDLRWMDEGGAGPLSGIVCPVFAGSRAGVDTATASARGSALLLAIQSYKKHYGKYPMSLAELKASIRWNLDTTDPFSGKDFIYKRDQNGFLLYSIGQNLKDDGGRDGHLPGKNLIQSGASKPDDITWNN